MVSTFIMFTYQCPPTAKPHRKSVRGRSVTPGSVGCQTGSHRFVRNGVVGNLCPVFVLRSNMCPPPGWLRPQPGLLDGSVSMDTGEGGRFFQENLGFPTNRVHSSGSVGFSIRESRVRSTWVTRRRGWLGSLPWSYRSKLDTVSRRWLLPRMELRVPLHFCRWSPMEPIPAI